MKKKQNQPIPMEEWILDRQKKQRGLECLEKVQKGLKTTYIERQIAYIYSKKLIQHPPKTIQREFYIQEPTYSFVGSTTMINAHDKLK